MITAKFRIAQMLRRMRGMVRWILQGLRPIESQKQRLLLIYDFESQPFSVGDILFLQAAALCESERQGLERIDVALVFDAAAPVVRDPAFGHITPEDFLFHLSSVLPAAQFNDRLGSLLLFDSHQRLEHYVTGNLKQYRTWPTPGLYASKQYLFYHCMNHVFPEFCRGGRSLPRLRPRPALRQWAHDFLALHAATDRRVSVQLRRNPKTPLRNSDYESWKRFFRHAQSSYPVRFFLICSLDEIDQEFRSLGNVVLAKDFQTTLEQDLALIESCDFHMGPSSGPGSIAMFNSRPYCMFGFDVDETKVSGLVHDGIRIRYGFSGQYQYWIREVESFALICSEFERLMLAANVVDSKL